MEEFHICISYDLEFIEENKDFPRCKSFDIKCSLDELYAKADILYQLKVRHVIKDFIIYSETLPSHD